MKTLTELIDVHDPGWVVVQEWLNAASNPYEVLAKDEARAEQALLQLQVTTRSPLGALVYETGGLLIDDGWLRILGSGSARLARDPMSWTQTATDAGSFAALLIADDASGGFFASTAAGLERISATSTTSRRMRWPGKGWKWATPRLLSGRCAAI